MNFKVNLFLAYAFLSLGGVANEVAAQQTYSIQSIAGSGLVGDGGPALFASFAQAEGIACSKAGIVYIADAADHRIRSVHPDGTIQTIAGTGSAGFAGDGGPAVRALFHSPYGMALDADGALFIADLGNHRIRRISPDGIVTTVAGGGTVLAGPAGDGGPATSVILDSPRNVLADSNNGFYFTDFAAHRVYYVDRQGSIHSFAGTGSDLDSPLRSPAGLAFDPQGGILVADSGNNVIRRVFRNTISVYSHSPNRSLPLYSPTDIAFDSLGNLFLADDRPGITLRRASNGEITSIAAGGRSIAVDAKGTVYTASGGLVRAIVTDSKNNLAVSIFAGKGNYGFSGDNGLATNARLNSPSGIAYDSSGNLYIADERNHRLRKVSGQGIITTAAGLGLSGYSGDGGPAINAKLNAPHAVAIDLAGYIYIAEVGNHSVRRISPSGFISTIAGDGVAGYRGDGGTATLARFREPSGLAINAKGDIYIADKGNGAIRKISTLGIISTEAQGLAFPEGLSFDAAGRLYIAESGGDRLLRLDLDGRLVTVSAADAPRGVAVDKDGGVYVSETAKHRVRKINGGIIGGTGFPGFDGDGGAALSAQFNSPGALVVDPDGSVFVADSGNHRIRKLTIGAALPPASDAAPVPFTLVRAASNQEGPMTAGELVILYCQEPFTSPELLFDGIPATILFQSKTQLNAVVPNAVLAHLAKAELRDAGKSRGIRPVEIVASAPILFSVPGEDQRALAWNENNRWNGPANPAVRLSLVTVFAAGFNVAESVALTLGGKKLLLSADPVVSDGIITIRFRIPAGFLPSGPQPLMLTVGQIPTKSLDLWID